MAKKPKSTVTYAKMKGIVSYFAALIKEKKIGSATSDLQQKPEISPIYRHMGSEYYPRPEGGGSGASGPASLCFTTTEQQLQSSQASAADFDYLKVIGTGSFGKVFLARHKKNERYYAVKVLQKHIILKKEAEALVMCEHNVLLKTLNHPFLVRLHFSFQTKDRLYLALDYAGGGELFYHLQRERVFMEPRARFYAAEMASALGYLHSLHIVYRDLKPENILLDFAGHVVLTDFGLCKEGMRGHATTRTFCGTPQYLAPEVLRQQEYDRTVDWWGLGAVLHEMLYGLPPFYSADHMEMLSNILFQPLALKPGVSKAGRDLLKRLLNRDRAKRLGAKNDVAELQRHSFFSSIQWDKLVAKKVPPPFVPSLSSPDDLTNINPAFTNLPVPESLGACEEAEMTFSDFSCISKNILPAFAQTSTG
ncbi:serine/threonine-protein kinase Sgk2b isoform X2 [Electrophorus electricus]|uniref:serine/threonine-protein kinase Sgk2b isoform X2 n=1 Tax=Electrophorus electricus TaxID=8005 RepID=UPI0015CF8B33|nr:serine/threonine-protein kinase Sgk2b isoform X2 [Electrophorus electricus]